jgi:hypothetical protein
MENSNGQILTLLRDRIKKIINLLEAEKDKNRVLESQSKQLAEKILDLQKEKEELRLRYNNLKLAKKLDASLDSSHDAKLKVNRIVREIDKCIALLNK